MAQHKRQKYAMDMMGRVVSGTNASRPDPLEKALPVSVQDCNNGAARARKLPREKLCVLGEHPTSNTSCQGVVKGSAVRSTSQRSQRQAAAQVAEPCCAREWSTYHSSKCQSVRVSQQKPKSAVNPGQPWPPNPRLPLAAASHTCRSCQPVMLVVAMLHHGSAASRNGSRQKEKQPCAWRGAHGAGWATPLHACITWRVSRLRPSACESSQAPRWRASWPLVLPWWRDRGWLSE